VSLTLAALWRHPVKSLGCEALRRVALTPGAVLPFDRTWALAHAASDFDFAAPAWVHCRNFLRVTHAPGLAQVTAAWDGARLTLTGPGAAPLTADPDAPEGAAAIAAWAERFAEGSRPGPYRLARAPQAMTDSDFPSVAVLSLSTLRALSQRVGLDLDPRRVRGNLWIEGAAPWEEAAWVGRTLAVGPARLRVREPIWRCVATEANPATGRRDAAVLDALRAATGDTAFGLYVEVVEGGEIAVGDAVTL
jgi:uncharacterized protein YcbX